MKKGLIITLITVLVLPFTVFAASSGVKTLDATGTTSGVKFTGTTDAGVLAVSCTLYDKESNDIDFVSVQVEDNKFNGTYTVPNGKYTVKCANYDGGTFIEKEVEVKSSETAPNTGDNIVLYVLLLGVSLTGIILAKKKVNA